MDIFEQKEEPSYQETVNAYVDRDNTMNLEIDIDRFTRHMTKLGYNPDEDVIRKEYDAMVRYETMLAERNNQDPPIFMSFTNYYQQKHQDKQVKWDYFYEALGTINKEYYYQKFSLDELKYLGY